MSSRLQKKRVLAQGMQENRKRVSIGCLLSLLAIAWIQQPMVLAEASGVFEGSYSNLMQEVVARLPRESLCISGNLHVRRKRGLPVADYGFQTVLEWGRSPSRTEYLITTANGTPLEKMIITRSSASDVYCSYFLGEELEAKTTPDLSQRIQRTDMSWTDLTLDFLWWPRSELVGNGESRGRSAWVIDVYPENADSVLEGAYARVRVWVDKQAFFLLRAQGFDTSETLRRELWVKSFKNIDDRWMIKDLEFQDYSTDHMTKLRVHDVRPTDEERDPDA